MHRARQCERPQGMCPSGGLRAAWFSGKEYPGTVHSVWGRPQQFRSCSNFCHSTATVSAYPSLITMCTGRCMSCSKKSMMKAT